jgi:Putative phage tail protein
MATINDIKEQSITETPLLLFECVLNSGAVERWSTHAAMVNGQQYAARVLRHDLFEMQSGGVDGIDAIAKISIWLANADSYFSEIERSTGWKGSRITAQFVFYDLKQGHAASEVQVLFKGVADAPAEITESTLRLTVTNSLNMQRLVLPDVRVERRCPWTFPATAPQRAEAATGGMKGQYSPFYRCGYSADVPGGCGALNGTTAYTSCDRTRAQCQARGMFAAGTARFGGIEFVPPTTVVRSYGEKGNHESAPLMNEARYNDFVPLVYGTAWYAPLVIFSKNDGNLTHMDVLLGMGAMEGVIKVLVNDNDIPVGRAGSNMTATGWYNVVTMGGRTGTFNPEYVDTSGNPLGDPYGSMAVLNVVVPNQINNGNSLPQILVLVEGMQLEQFSADGSPLGRSFTNNPAWVLLDLLRRCGWALGDIDIASFAQAGAYCGEAITAQDLNGNPISIPRFQCNLVLKNRRSAADTARGVRNGSRLFLRYGLGGLLGLNVENTLALQQPTQPDGSNADEAVTGGWPAYEFGDGTAGLSGILRRPSEEPWIRVWSRSTAETPNRLSLEFQDAFNQYQQDSLSVTDVDDMLAVGQEVNLNLPALGIANFNQAARITKFQLDKLVAGNTYVEFATTMRGLKLRPGDLITVTYLKEGFEGQPFRVVKIAPGLNYSTALITAQIHQDAWYGDNNADVFGSGLPGRQPGYGIGTPRPVTGEVLDQYRNPQLEITEQDSANADGTMTISLAAGFNRPRQPAVTGLGIPLIGIAAGTQDTGGSLAGNQTLYYAVTGSDASGQESALSFVVPATIPDGTNTNTVTLTELSFTSDATGFSVYRGPTPMQLAQIATNQAIAATFTDNGLAASLTPPPDENYDHTNAYWRLELQPEIAAATASGTTVGNPSLTMDANVYAGMVVRITRGTGAGQEKTVAGNDATALTISQPWDTEPDATSYFTVAEAGWHFGSAGSSGPLAFQVPNRIGATVQATARAANVYDRECPAELCLVTRWRITGGTPGSDEGVPSAPVFGILTRGSGDVGLTGVGFQNPANTSSISSGTLALYYWNELVYPSPNALGADAGAGDTIVNLAQAGSILAGDLVQIDAELIQVEQVGNNGLQLNVLRGAMGSTAAAHKATAPVYGLTKVRLVVPFTADFFGSPASGDFAYFVLLPDARVTVATFFVTNAFGDSPTTAVNFMNTGDTGLRTLSGGQYSIQVAGNLAVESNAAPPLVVQGTHVVWNISARVSDAPANAPSGTPVESVEMDVRLNGAVYCHLSIPAGRTYSNTVNGCGMPALPGGGLITLDITAVPQAPGSKPGRDLTVTINL